jgi:hypothetical protein
MPHISFSDGPAFAGEFAEIEAAVCAVGRPSDKEGLERVENEMGRQMTEAEIYHAIYSDELAPHREAREFLRSVADERFHPPKEEPVRRAGWLRNLAGFVKQLRAGA